MAAIGARGGSEQGRLEGAGGREEEGGLHRMRMVSAGGRMRRSGGDKEGVLGGEMLSFRVKGKVEIGRAHV